MKSTKRKLLLRVAVAILILGVTIAAVCVCDAASIRSWWGAIGACVAGACLLYAYMSLKCMPWYHYWKYLVDMRNGLSHETEGWFVSMSDDTRMSDGVMFHDFVIRIGEQEDDQRLFFWDDDFPLPALKEGQPVVLRSFGNYIINLA